MPARAPPPSFLVLPARGRSRRRAGDGGRRGRGAGPARVRSAATDATQHPVRADRRHDPRRSARDARASSGRSARRACVHARDGQRLVVLPVAHHHPARASTPTTRRRDQRRDQRRLRGGVPLRRRAVDASRPGCTASGYRTGLIGKYLNGFPNTASESYRPPGWTTWVTPVAGNPYNEYGYRLDVNGRFVDHGFTAADYGTTRVPAPRPPLHRRGRRVRTARSSSTSRSTRRTVRPRRRRCDVDRFRGRPLPHPPSFDESDIRDKPRWLRTVPLMTPAGAAPVAGAVQPAARVAPGRRPWRRRAGGAAAPDGSAAEHLHRLHVRQRLPQRPAPAAGGEADRVRRGRPRPAAGPRARAWRPARRRARWSATSTSRRRSPAWPGRGSRRSSTAVRSRRGCTAEPPRDGPARVPHRALARGRVVPRARRASRSSRPTTTRPTRARPPAPRTAAAHARRPPSPAAAPPRDRGRPEHPRVPRRADRHLHLRRVPRRRPRALRPAARSVRAHQRLRPRDPRDEGRAGRPARRGSASCRAKQCRDRRGAACGRRSASGARGSGRAGRRDAGPVACGGRRAVDASAARRGRRRGPVRGAARGRSRWCSSGPDPGNGSTTPRSRAGWCSTRGRRRGRNACCAPSRSARSRSSASRSWPSPLARGRWHLALGAGAVIVGANVTTEVFKALVHRPHLVNNPLISFNTLPERSQHGRGVARRGARAGGPGATPTARGHRRRPLRRAGSRR